MAETELESMVVRLVGDIGQYVDQLQTAAKETVQAAAQVQKQTEKIESFTQSLKGFAAGAVSALTTLGAGGFLKSAFGSFADAEQGQIRLRAAVESNGRAVDETLEKYKEYAAALKDLKGVSAGETTALLRMAENMGMTGSAATQAVTNALALAAATNTEAESMMRLVSALNSGNTELVAHMARHVEGLQNIKNEDELLARVNQLLMTGERTQIALMNSADGIMKRFHNTVGALTKQFGALVAEAVIPAVQIITWLANEFTHLDESTKRIIVTAALMTVGVIALWSAVNSGLALFNLLSGGMLTLIGLLVVGSTAIAAWVEQVGGFREVWQTVGTAAVGAWQTIKEKAAAFWQWIKPAVDEGLSLLTKGWNKLRETAGAVWDFVRGYVGAFIDWVRPYFQVFVIWAIEKWKDFKEFAVETWETIKQKVSAFVGWAKPIVLAYVGYLSAQWALTRDIAVAAWGLIRDGASRAWEGIKSVFSALGDVAADVWNQITGGASVTWQSVQDFMVNALIAGEFGLRNIVPIAEWVWTGVKLKVVEAANSHVWFFTEVIPAALSWFRENFVAIVSSVWNWMTQSVETTATNVTTVWQSIPWEQLWEDFKASAKEAAQGVITNLVTTMKNLPALLSGGAIFGDLWAEEVKNTGKAVQDIGKGLQRLPDVARDAVGPKGIQPFILPPREMGAMEQQLREEFDKMGAALGMNFQEFREKRLKEIGAFNFFQPANQQEEMRKMAGAAGQAGEAAGRAQVQGVQKELSKLDGVLYNSAAAFGKVSKYMEQFQAPAKAAGAAGAIGKMVGAAPGVAAPPAGMDPEQARAFAAGIGGGPAAVGGGANSQPVPQPRAEPVDRELNRQTGLLTEIRDVLKWMKEKAEAPGGNGIQLDVANLFG